MRERHNERGEEKRKGASYDVKSEEGRGCEYLAGNGRRMEMRTGRYGMQSKEGERRGGSKVNVLLQGGREGKEGGQAYKYADKGEGMRGK